MTPSWSRASEAGAGSARQSENPSTTTACVTGSASHRSARRRLSPCNEQGGRSLSHRTLSNSTGAFKHATGSVRAGRWGCHTTKLSRRACRWFGRPTVAPRDRDPEVAAVGRVAVARAAEPLEAGHGVAFGDVAEAPGPFGVVRPIGQSDHQVSAGRHREPREPDRLDLRPGDGDGGRCLGAFAPAAEGLPGPRQRQPAQAVVVQRQRPQGGVGRPLAGTHRETVPGRQGAGLASSIGHAARHHAGGRYRRRRVPWPRPVARRSPGCASGVDRDLHGGGVGPSRRQDIATPAFGRH